MELINLLGNAPRFHRCACHVLKMCYKIARFLHKPKESAAICTNAQKCAENVLDERVKRAIL